MGIRYLEKTIKLPGWQRTMALALILAATGRANAADGFPVDRLGLPAVEIRFLDPPAGTERAIPFPNSDFHEINRDGLPRGWSISRSGGKPGNAAIRNLPDGKRSLEMTDFAILYTNRIPVDRRLEYRLSFSC